jgi:hypothetical protein
MKSVFIVEPDNQGWIIEKLMRDLAAELITRGFSVNIGKAKHYNSEHIVFNSRYLNPFFSKKAKINSLFVTHVDDNLKIAELRYWARYFNSIVCFSEHDQSYIASLLPDKSGIVGIDLPSRSTVVAPIKLGLFSSFYSDGRKNEEWILEYFKYKSKDEKNSFLINLLGANWGNYCVKLDQLDLNYRVHRYASCLKQEYDMYKNDLSEVDYLIYLGFDSGAMSIYDGLELNKMLIFPKLSYHVGVPGSDLLFSSKTEFFSILDMIEDQVQKKKDFLNHRSISSYADKLINHWFLLSADNHNPPQKTLLNEYDIRIFVENKRKINAARIRQFVIRLFQNLVIDKF